MSKRLNKRAQREIEELEALKLEESRAAKAELEEDTTSDEGDAGVVNPFAALDDKRDKELSSSDEDPEPSVSAPKKTKKKKPKKKKASSNVTPIVPDEDLASSVPATGTPKSGKKKKGKVAPSEEMDDVDRALAELRVKYGEESHILAEGSKVVGGSSSGRSALAFRNLLSVDPKNLDADAELRRFFGSKVIASSAQTSGPNRHRPNLSTKLRSTLAKPKPNWPPVTSLTGLGMRELSEMEVEYLYSRRGLEMMEGDRGDKWFTFEHSAAWREIQKQFMGAVGSHDPNELMALLSVYPWHVDTLLQMSEVYRLQSDIGAASEYAERALFAFDRCLIPSFSVSLGTVRLDFDRVENRPMFTALHRIISYLGRRGCWVTAFNFAKLLFALDPEGDPHGAVLWLDFLAVKSGNSAWLLSLLSSNSIISNELQGYPGIAYAKALAHRAEEESSKSKDHTKSDEALQTAILTFPQVVVLLADKIGASVPSGARTHPATQIEVGYSDTSTNVIHLLSHIYVARSEALWKEASNMKWFETVLDQTFSSLETPNAKNLRSTAEEIIHHPRDFVDESLKVPLYICRHVVCSESTSWIGFLPPSIRSKPVHAFDPLPPTTSISMYNQEYFSGISRSRGRVQQNRGGEGLENAVGGMTAWFTQRLRDLMAGDVAEWPEALGEAFREMVQGPAYAQVPIGEREAVLQRFLQVAEGMIEGYNADPHGRMPGGFPGGGEGETDD